MVPGSVGSESVPVAFVLDLSSAHHLGPGACDRAPTRCQTVPTPRPHPRPTRFKHWGRAQHLSILQTSLPQELPEPPLLRNTVSTEVQHHHPGGVRDLGRTCVWSGRGHELRVSSPPTQQLRHAASLLPATAEGSSGQKVEWRGGRWAVAA